jgi:hypothetical protein
LGLAPTEVFALATLESPIDRAVIVIVATIQGSTSGCAHARLMRSWAAFQQPVTCHMMCWLCAAGTHIANARVTCRLWRHSCVALALWGAASYFKMIGGLLVYNGQSMRNCTTPIFSPVLALFCSVRPFEIFFMASYNSRFVTRPSRMRRRLGSQAGPAPGTPAAVVAALLAAAPTGTLQLPPSFSNDPPGGPGAPSLTNAALEPARPVGGSGAAEFEDGVMAGLAVLLRHHLTLQVNGNVATRRLQTPLQMCGPGAGAVSVECQQSVCVTQASSAASTPSPDGRNLLATSCPLQPKPGAYARSVATLGHAQVGLGPNTLFQQALLSQACVPPSHVCHQSSQNPRPLQPPQRNLHSRLHPASLATPGDRGCAAGHFGWGAHAEGDGGPARRRPQFPARAGSAALWQPRRVLPVACAAPGTRVHTVPSGR